MEKNISIYHLSNLAWQASKEYRKSFMLLMLGSFALGGLQTVLEYYLPVYTEMIKLLFVVLQAVYASIWCNNGLDIVYGRKLRMLHISSYIFIAAFFYVTTISRLLKYVNSSIIQLISIENVIVKTGILLAISLLQVYIIIRCAFISMVILEDKLSVIDACKKSWNMSGRCFFVLLQMVGYIWAIMIAAAVTFSAIFIPLSMLIPADVISSNTLGIVLGLPMFGFALCTVIPYIFLMFAFLFKQMNEQVK